MMKAGRTLIIMRCNECTAESATIDDVTAPAAAGDHFRTIDAERYERSVRCTREASYHSLLDHVERFAGKPRRWLDVGCSYGWLLEHLRARGIDGFGVEPSPGAVEDSRRLGLKVTRGIFPQVSGPGAPYDVISFIDVLEHLPNPEMILNETKKRLAPGGLVVVQVPDQACALYWLARVLARWSWGHLDFALKRLWLVGLDFPHLVYFTRTSLTNLFSRCGFDVVDMYRAPISHPLQAHDRVTFLPAERYSRMVSTAVGAINAVDAVTGHGGLLVALAVPRQSGSPE